MAQRLDRINRFLDGVKRNRREIISPEGIVLEVDVANNGERLMAFVIDLLFWMLATALLYLMLALMIVEHINAAVGGTIIFFIAFLIRNLYFIHFELTSQGSTPGKRIAKITTLSIAPLIGEAIKRIHRGESVGALFSSEVEFTQEMLLWEDGIARKLDIRLEPGHGDDDEPGTGAGSAGREAVLPVGAAEGENR